MALITFGHKKVDAQKIKRNKLPWINNTNTRTYSNK